KADDGIPTPAGTPVVPPRRVTLAAAEKDAAGRFRDLETRSLWDVAGRCVAGELKGYTLEWVDSVQVKWFAWAAEYPDGSIHAGRPPAPPTPAEANQRGGGRTRYRLPSFSFFDQLAGHVGPRAKCAIAHISPARVGRPLRS